MAEYRLAPAALDDLEAIWGHTLKQWGNAQAERYIDDLTAAFIELTQLPLAAPSCDYIRPGYRRRTVGRHMIYYRVTEYGIAVIRILHDRMDASRHL